MKKKFLAPISLIIILLVAGIGLYLQQSTYDDIETIETYENIGSDNGNYVQYLDGVLKYSKDGISMLSRKGEELWNQPCQMNRPMVDLCGDTVAVADKEGTSILIFQRQGVKGEIQTTKPIEKFAVSEQGIIAAILQDEKTPRIMCYDAKGNILVEHKASLTNTGYPIDIALSNDGNVLLVSYLCINGSTLNTKIAYYHFGEAGEKVTDHQVAQSEYENTLIPTVAFLDDDSSLLVTDHSFIIYGGLEEPKEVAVVELDKEIKSVAYNEKYIAFVLRSTEKTGYELCLYYVNGSEVMRQHFEGEYTNIKIAEDQILLYSGNLCAIFNNKGICKYQGIMESNIMDIFPVSGLNRYFMMSTSGFSEIRLVK